MIDGPLTQSALITQIVFVFLPQLRQRAVVAMRLWRSYSASIDQIADELPDDEGRVSLPPGTAFLGEASRVRFTERSQLNTLLPHVVGERTKAALGLAKRCSRVLLALQMLKETLRVISEQIA